MKLSAQIWAFALLVVVLLGAIVLADGFDFDTDVKTASETLLPLSFIDPSTNLSFRYPADWTVAPVQAGQISLTAPVEAESETVPASFFLWVEQYSAEQTADMESLVLGYITENGLPIEPDDVESTEYNGLPAARYVLPIETNVAVIEMIRLTDELVLNLQVTGPISDAEWDRVEEDVNAILATVDNTNVQLPEVPTAASPESTPGAAPAAAISLPAAPAGWQAVQSSALSLTVDAANAEGPQSRIQVVADRPANIVTGLGLPEGEYDSPAAMLSAFGLAQGMAIEPVPTSLLGFDGARVDIPGEQPGTVFLVDAGDDVYIFASSVFINAAAQELYAPEVITILDSLVYDPALAAEALAAE